MTTRSRSPTSPAISISGCDGANERERERDRLGRRPRRPAEYRFISPVGASRCIGPRTVPVRSGSAGARTAEFSRPVLTFDALRTGTVRGPFARAATTLNRYPAEGFGGAYG